MRIIMLTSENKPEGDENKKREKKETAACQESLKTTTETTTYFHLTKFNSKDVSYEEKLPRNFKEFDELLKKILLTLEETENVFLNQAKAVMDRDLTLINWRLRLKKLYKNLKHKKREFERMDQTVQCILRLCNHIESILTRLEKELPEASLIQNAFKYCPSRMSMYDSMLKISISQRDMLEQISRTVLCINEGFVRDLSDPVEQFLRILSLHLEILTSIEVRTESVKEQLEVVKKLQIYYRQYKKPIINDYYC